MISLASIAKQYQQQLLDKYRYKMQATHCTPSSRSSLVIHHKPVPCYITAIIAILPLLYFPPADIDTALHVNILPIMTG